jgi:hypothetical protein
MIEKPILFSGSMVIAIDNDLKDVTRRVINPQPPDFIDYFVKSPIGFLGFRCYEDKIRDGEFCRIKPKYDLGDRLWVRETWAINGYSNESAYEIGVRYKANNKDIFDIDLDNEERWKRYIKNERKYLFKNCGYTGPVCIEGQSGCLGCKYFKGKSPFLWRSACFMPRATARLFLDVVAIGIERLHELDDTEARREGFTNREKFIEYWNGLNKKRGFPWDSNPWVTRIEFKKVKN